MVRIRLRRIGAKKKPFYRVVVANQRSPRDGRFIEAIGTYDPHPEPPVVSIDAERAAHWIAVGAQPSEAVARILRQQNITDENGNLVERAGDAADAHAAEQPSDADVTENSEEAATAEA